MKLSLRGKVIVEQDEWPSCGLTTIEYSKTISGEAKGNIMWVLKIFAARLEWYIINCDWGSTEGLIVLPIKDICEGPRYVCVVSTILHGLGH